MQVQQKGGVQGTKLFVKLFIMVTSSNAMNLQEIPLVPSLHKAIVPGLYARLRSASLGLPRSGRTWIISRPDCVGLQDLALILWLTSSTFRRPTGFCPQAGNTNHFTSHFDWFGIHLPEPVQARSSHFSYLHLKGPKISQTSKIPWAVQLTRLLRFGSLDPILDPTFVLV